MKRIIIAALFMSLLSGCGATAFKAVEPKVEEVEHIYYFTEARYYTNGEVITNDGNVWNYSTDIISDKPSYDNEPILAGFDDNGTPNDIVDDIIVGVVFDRETAIYDALEIKLGEAFVVEREGNNIRLSTEK